MNVWPHRTNSNHKEYRDSRPILCYTFSFHRIISQSLHSLRRGFEVYRQVCSTCHSLKYIAFRHLVGVTHTEKQAKMIAKSYEIVDGPNDEGEMFERPGKLIDHLPRPFPNDEAARFANGGALPPDLSLQTKARHHGDIYIYSLLTGYKEPPAGVHLRDGNYYNPYFVGGSLSMAPPLTDGCVEYEDGTVASVPQMAKDVTSFLCWTAKPELDQRKLNGIKICAVLFLGLIGAGWWKRLRWNPFKTRKIVWTK